MSFKPMIQTADNSDYYPNSTAFATREEAERAAKDIYTRWWSATDWRVDESDQPVNWAFIDGVMTPVAATEVV